MKLTDDEKELLLRTARQSILSALNESTKPEIDYTAHPLLKQKLGAFVTLKINEQLRGCIGYIAAIGPLFETICETARSAAFNDPVFETSSRSLTSFFNFSGSAG